MTVTAPPVDLESRLRARLDRALAAAAPQRVGSVEAVIGLSVDVTGVAAGVGDVLELEDGGLLEVVSTSRGSVRCMPLAHAAGLRPGMAARHTGGPLRVPVGGNVRGRVLDGLGRPMDGLGPVEGAQLVGVEGEPPNAMDRLRVNRPLPLGVRALDTLVPAGRGQRFGLFAGSGVGKSSLLSMIARGTEAQMVVLALIGERGREVREFLEDDLGPEGLARSVVVVATSDQPALVRLRAAQTATRIAEHYRDQGMDVVLMMDSLTRYAMAQREIGLSVGEPPATRGYPPSVFATLPRLLERAGSGVSGTITGIYTVLVDGDDHDEPIADAARSILDGHVVLTRKLATAGHFPSIDVLESVSRVVSRVTTKEQRAAATVLRSAMAARRDIQDLLDVGAYVPGSNPVVDAAMAHEGDINAFLRQGIDDPADYETSWRLLEELAARLGG